MIRPLLSIRARLLTVAAVWIVVAWVGAAGILSYAFTEAVRDRFDVKVGTILRSATGVLRLNEEDGTYEIEPLPLDEPRFDIAQSGWYWQVKTNDRVLIRSPSLGDFVLPLDLSVEPEAIRMGEDRGPRGETLRTAETAIPLSDGRLATVKVAVEDTHVREEIEDFETLIHLSLGTLATGLAVALLVQVHLGLQPLRRLQRELQRFQDGEQEELEDRYPWDLRPVVAAINAVIERNRLVIDRTRRSAGNLAHALKTELALLKSTLANGAGAPRPELDGHIDRIAQIIDHHLQRAATVGVCPIAARPVELAEVVDNVCGALQRIHQVRQINIDWHVDGEPRFKGEKQDLEEMIGNLVENACKHAHTRVLVAGTNGPNEISIRVDDDGAGMTERQAALAVQRGKRLDERSGGSGLGLSIVADLAEAYGGSLDLSASALGGLNAVLRLPARA